MLPSAESSILSSKKKPNPITESWIWYHLQTPAFPGAEHPSLFMEIFPLWKYEIFLFVEIKQVAVSPLAQGWHREQGWAIGNCSGHQWAQGGRCRAEATLGHAAVRLFHQCNQNSHQKKQNQNQTKNVSNQRKTRENQSREFKELFKFNETNRVLYVMLSWMDICKIIYKVLYFFWAAGAQHTDGDMVFALYVDWMAWFSR